MIELQLNDNSDAFLENLDALAVDAVQETVAAVAEHAKILAPVASGELRASIREDTEQIATRHSGEVGATAPYAPYVHNGYTHVGGKFMPGRPFLAEAATLEQEAFKHRVADGLAALSDR